MQDGVGGASLGQAAYQCDVWYQLFTSAKDAGGGLGSKVVEVPDGWVEADGRQVLVDP